MRTRLPILLTFLIAATLCADEGNLVKNGSFDRDVGQWSFWFAPGEGEGEAKWIARDGGGALQVDVARRKRNSSIQIYYGPFTVKKGQRYEASFQAKAEEGFDMRVSLMRHEAPYGNLGLSAEVPLPPEWRTYSLVAVATEDCPIARIDFFPEKTFTLDAVSVRPVAAGQAIKPAEVLLGPDWRGDPKALLDGNPKTRISSHNQPAQPIFLTVDLGAPKPIQQVVVHGVDAGRHHYTRRMDVEVSNDGQRWFHWARCTKDGRGPNYHPTTFQASSLTVGARYLRLRISGIRSGCILTGLDIFGGGTAKGIDPSLLRAIHPARDLTFEGWDYKRLGYALTPGERPKLLWTNRGTADVEVPITWRISTYDGHKFADGQALLGIKAGQTDGLSFDLPMGLDDGPKRIRCIFPEGSDVPDQLFYFDYRAPAGDDDLDLFLVALHDSQDPEGWSRMMAGPLQDHIVASRDWPEGEDIDAAVVMIENWPPDDPRIVKLKDYVKGGGKALVYGKPPAALHDMIPVTVDAKAPLIAKPMNLRLCDGGPWSGFNPSTGPRHYGIRVTARNGATVLATWEDGTPAAVAGDFGKGKVIYVGAGSGQVWQDRPELAGADELGLRLLYRLAGRDKAVDAMRVRAGEVVGAAKMEREAAANYVFEKLAVPRPKRTVVTSVDNVGRFGWKVSEGGLVDNISEDGSVRCPAEANYPLSFVMDEEKPPTARSVEQNWLAKTIAWSDGERDVLRATISLASPGILWEGEADAITLRVPGVTHMAISSADGARIVPDGKAVSGQDMAANWIVLFAADKERRDCPKLLVLTRRPKEIKLEGGLLHLSFAGRGFGVLFTSHLWGLQRLALGTTVPWTKALPKEAMESARVWSRAFLSFPVGCDEVAWLNGDTVLVADRFRYRTITDDWRTKPLPLAPVPPVVSLARKDGAPLKIEGEVIDCGIATKYGPLEAIEEESVLYRIALPTHDHYGPIPVQGKMDLAKAIDSYALQGIGSGKRPSGGLTSGSEFLADLREYMSSGSYEFAEAPCIDLYKWWYCFPTILARPALGPEARQKVDAHYRRRYWQTLNFYPHKCFIRYRREPWTNLDYTISFIWPVMVQNGVRYFVDQNESAAVIAYCTWAYAQYYGDWSTLRANWNLCRRLYEYLPKFHDWAWMASSNQEFFSTCGIDMLNAEYPGNLAFARAARMVGDEQGELIGMVLAAKALVPAVARFGMPDYVKSITAEGDPWREARYYFSLHETTIGGAKSIEMRGGPESVLYLAIGMLDTSKGTSPEICLGYKSWVPKRIDAYERDLKAAEAHYGKPAGWMHLMQRAILGWPRAEPIATAKAFHKAMPNWGWQSTKGPHPMALICTDDTGLFLDDWSPAEYLSGGYDPGKRTVTLRFRSHEAGGYTIRLYSQRAVLKVSVNGKAIAKPAYDPKTGWLTVDLSGTDEKTLLLQLGNPVAPPHPYSTAVR